MRPQLKLVADIGGTNTRIALADNDVVEQNTAASIKNSKIENLGATIVEYVEKASEIDVVGACIAVAGPVVGNRATLTNISWVVDGNELSASLHGIPVLVINDMQAIGYALHLLDQSDLEPVVAGRREARHSPRLVINAGTGFNAAAVHDIGDGLFVAPSECGHAMLPVHDAESYALYLEIVNRGGFASIEDVLSGRGAKMVRHYIEANLGIFADDDRFIPKYNAILAQTLGCVARNLALTHLPFGGIFLNGGLLRGIASDLVQSGFSAVFRDAGRFSKFMDQFSVDLIRDDMAALRGCAVSLDLHKSSI